MSTFPEGAGGFPLTEKERVSPPKRMCALSPSVGNKGEYLYYCHRGDALSADPCKGTKRQAVQVHRLFLLCIL